MSNEIKNREHASALIAPEPAAPFTTPIVASVGVSGYTRNSEGNYLIELTDAAPFHTHRVVAALGANVLGRIGAQLTPDGASVLVTAFDDVGAPADPQFFSLAVETIRDGEGVGPAPAAPAVPTPTPVVGAGGLLGWARVDADATILGQSTSAPVDSVAVDGGDPGRFNYTMVAGTVLAALGIEVDSTGTANAGSTGAEVVTATTAAVYTGASRLRHFAFFYSA